MPHVTEITVSASRKFNHPYEQYSNLGSHVTLKAGLAEGESIDTAYGELQAQAEKLVEEHKQDLLKNLEELEQLSRNQERVSVLRRQIEQAQRELANMQQQLPALPPAGTLCQSCGCAMTADEIRRGECDCGEVITQA